MTRARARRRPTAISQASPKRPICTAIASDQARLLGWLRQAAPEGARADAGDPLIREIASRLPGLQRELRAREQAGFTDP